MGETVEFPSNGSTASGYLATPSSGSGPGVIVIQEWWGLVPQIKQQCEEFAAEGLVALAPDLYHGEVAQHEEPDAQKAQQLMESMPPDRVARDMRGAVDYLLGLDSVQGEKVGVVGFCMGGMLTWVLASLHADKVGAAVPYYGAPLGDDAPDVSRLKAPILGHFAENDDFFSPDAVREFIENMRRDGKDIEAHFYPGTGHGFTNETNALGTYDPHAKQQAWTRTLAFLRKHLA